MAKKLMMDSTAVRVIAAYTKKPHVYIAGKISKSDFRHQLIPGLRNHHWGNGFMETDAYVYTGPFFQSCDHGCSHGPSTHGATEGCGEGFTHDDILARNNHAIDNADLVFAYITHPDCHGTLVEIGRAAPLGKRIVVAFATDFEHKADFWYAAHTADVVYQDVNPCCLPGLLGREIDRLSRGTGYGTGDVA